MRFDVPHIHNATIIAVARKIPENVLQDAHKLLMCSDQVMTRTEGEEK